MKRYIRSTIVDIADESSDDQFEMAFASEDPEFLRELINKKNDVRVTLAVICNPMCPIDIVREIANSEANIFKRVARDILRNRGERL